MSTTAITLNKNTPRPADRLIDYRSFRLSKLKGEFSYLLYLIFWPVFGLAFLFMERFYTPKSWNVIYTGLDDLIPFCELFLIPYMFWFVYLVGTLGYTLLFNSDAFVRMMRFIIFTYTVTIIIYILYPNCQELRPEAFPRDNPLTRFTASFYEFDTNTNVCPSIHVIGSVAAMLAAWDTERFSSPGFKLSFGIAAFLISISTVFMKQHSIIDVIAAAALCAVGYAAVYLLPKIKYSRGLKEEKVNEKVS